MKAFETEDIRSTTVSHSVNNNSNMRSSRAIWREMWTLIRSRRGALAIGLLLITISRLSGLVLPASVKYLVDDVLTQHHFWLLRPLILAVMGATILQVACAYGVAQVLSKTAQRLTAELRIKVQKHIGRLPIAYFDSNKTGLLVSRVINDVDSVRNLISTGLVEFTGNSLTVLFVLILLFQVSALMTLLALGLIFAFVFILRKAVSILTPIYKNAAEANADMIGRLTESLGGARVIKGYRAEDREEQVFASSVHRLLAIVLRSITATALVQVSAILLMGMVCSLVMYIGAHKIMAGTLTLGDLGKFMALILFFALPMVQLVNMTTPLTQALAGLERTLEVLGEKPEDSDPRRTLQSGYLLGKVVFENVRFSYIPGIEVLHDISFSAEPGSITALVGASGGGKSTITGLIASFYAPDSGTIWVDDLDLSLIQFSSYRSQLGLVLQETFLFDGSVRENVAFSRPDASEEEIMDACKMARVDEFVDRFVEKYDTLVGERGVKLSGGQRQRVSIARAILANPRILVLDEATSSLDSESEQFIQEGLKCLMRGRSTFVIAHRMATIRRADQILVIETGRIVERGTHDSLLAAHGRYYDLYTKQHGVEANLFRAPGEDSDLAEAVSVNSAPESQTTSSLSPVIGHLLVD